MVQGLPGMATYRGPFDVINKVVRTEGIRGLYRGFGITMLTQSPASALWWSAHGGAQHAIWRCVYFYLTFIVHCVYKDISAMVD
jgi:solute carrier family 25 protein 44